MKSKSIEEFLSIERECRNAIREILACFPHDSDVAVAELMRAEDLTTGFLKILNSAPQQGRILLQAAFAVLVNSYSAQAIEKEFESRQS
jgi:hypothetical protein